MMLQRLFHRRMARVAILIGLEGVLIAAAIEAARWIRFGPGGVLEQWTWSSIIPILVVAVTCQVSLYYADLYNFKILADRREVFVRLIQALGATAFVLALLYFLFPGVALGRGVFVIAAVLVLVLVMSWRLLFEWVTQNVRPRERLLLVGTGPASVALARELHERRTELGVQIVGFIDTDIGRVGESLVNPGIVGTIEDIPSVVRARSVDRVVVSLSEARGRLPMDKLLEMKLDGITFDHLASVYEDYTGKIAVENLRPSWLVFSEGFRKTRWAAILKRLLDVALSVTALIALLPVMVAVAIAVRLGSRGPVLFHQARVGQFGRVFVLHKMRSMTVDAEASTGPVWSTPGDPRITPVGRFLRRTRLDELPQLWNVLMGDMSFVGPRPERPEFVAALTREIPFYGQRHIVRPGITGWAQVRYTYGASTEDAMQKLQYDLYYIKNMGLLLDLFILFSTLKVMLLRRGA